MGFYIHEKLDSCIIYVVSIFLDLIYESYSQYLMIKRVGLKAQNVREKLLNYKIFNFINCNMSMMTVHIRVNK